MNYPPTLLQNFKASEEDQQPGGILQNIRNFIRSTRVQYDDLVLIVDEGKTPTSRTNTF